MCVNNMNIIVNTQFSCAAGDTACFCTQSNWAYGVRDCSRQACSGEESAQAVSYAAGLCQGESSPAFYSQTLLTQFRRCLFCLRLHHRSGGAAHPDFGSC